MGIKHCYGHLDHLGLDLLLHTLQGGFGMNRKNLLSIFGLGGLSPFFQKINLFKKKEIDPNKYLFELVTKDGESLGFITPSNLDLSKIHHGATKKN